MIEYQPFSLDLSFFKKLPSFSEVVKVCSNFERISTVLPNFNAEITASSIIFPEMELKKDSLLEEAFYFTNDMFSRESVFMEYAIETKGLVKHYNNGKIHAVNGLDLKIRKGEIYAFIGANGSGKTTTIDMLSGVLMPTAGDIRIWGLSQPKYRKQIARYIGIAPQEYSLYLDLSVWENIMFFGRLYGLSRRKLNIAGEELLDILNLRSKRDAPAEELSGGLKRRLSIAIALIHNPPLLLFDEATVGIDPVLRAYFWDYFRSLRDAGKTILITSHVMDEAEKADRIGLLRSGKLIEEGCPADLKAKHRVSTVEEIFLKLSGEDFVDE